MVSGKSTISSFDFWQKFGKALLVVIAVMPAAGLMISLGKVIGIFGGSAAIIQVLSRMIEDMGWGIIVNLHLLFAVAIGGSWAKERAGGSFAAVIAFVLINRLTGSILAINLGMLTDKVAVVSTLFGNQILVKDYFISVLGSPALNMGVFIGIISGFLGAALYNRYYNYDKLPSYLAFFNGKRFVPFVVIAYSMLLALVLVALWPIVQSGINDFGKWIATSKDSAPFISTFLFGSLERLLLPFGLHHLITIPINYTQLGGTYHILSGDKIGQVVYGQDPLWLAWITDLNNLKTLGDMNTYNTLLAEVHPARFKIGQVITSTATLMAAALAMYKNVEPEKRGNYKSMYLSAALAVFLTGVTEPIEFMFMLTSPILYGVYAVFTGMIFAIADLIMLRIHAFGFIELLTRTPLIINGGLSRDLINFVIVCLVTFGVAYGMFDYLIRKLNIPTPGRAGNDVEMVESEQHTKQIGVKGELADTIIRLLGGKENIVDIDACMTRLRVTVKEVKLVATAGEWKSTNALGVIMKDKGVQVIYGPKVDVIKSNVLDALGI